MSKKNLLVPVLAGTLVLGGCHGGRNSANSPSSGKEPGGITVEADVSDSTPFMTSPDYTDAAVKRVGEAVLKQRLGDRFRIVPIGDRSVANSIASFALVSGQRTHLSTVRKRMEAALTGLFAEQRSRGGNGSTNILYALQNSHPLCSSGSAIYILSDGIEASSEANIGAALAAGKPIKLPEPSEQFLKGGGCSITMIGIGVTSPAGGGTNVQMLPDAQLDSLKSAWRSWFVSAGADPANVHFETIL